RYSKAILRIIEIDLGSKILVHQPLKSLPSPIINICTDSCFVRPRNQISGPSVAFALESAKSPHTPPAGGVDTSIFLSQMRYLHGLAQPFFIPHIMAEQRVNGGSNGYH